MANREPDFRHAPNAAAPELSAACFASARFAQASSGRLMPGD